MKNIHISKMQTQKLSAQTSSAVANIPVKLVFDWRGLFIIVSPLLVPLLLTTALVGLMSLGRLTSLLLLSTLGLLALILTFRLLTSLLGLIFSTFPPVSLPVLMSFVKNATRRAHAFFQRCLERTWKNMDFFEIYIQNMKFFQALKAWQMDQMSMFESLKFWFG